MKLYAEFQRFNVFRKPSWRFDKVLRLCDRHPSPGRCTHRDDEYVRKARSFLLRWRSRAEMEDREDLFWETPGLFYAYMIHERSRDDPEPGLMIQARLLARQGFDEIAEIAGTIPETIEWYEALFFNVCDRLENRDWITTHVLLPAILRRHGQKPYEDEDDGEPVSASVYSVVKDYSVCHPFLDASLKLFAYFGGKYLIDVMITGFQAGKPLTSPEAMGEWFDRNFAMTIKRRSTQAALQFQVNRFTVMELFNTCTRVMEIEKSDDSQAQARSLIETHTKAMIDDIPWLVGQEGEDLLAGTALGEFDAGAAELRDDELHRVAAGLPAGGPAVPTLAALPAPRPRKKARPGPEAEDPT